METRNIVSEILFRIAREKDPLVAGFAPWCYYLQEGTPESVAIFVQKTIDAMEENYPDIQVSSRHAIPLIFDLLQDVLRADLEDLTINQGVRILMQFRSVLSQHDDDIFEALAAGLVREPFMKQFEHALMLTRNHDSALFVDPINLSEKLIWFYVSEKIRKDCSLPKLQVFAEDFQKRIGCRKRDIRNEFDKLGIFMWEQSWEDDLWKRIESDPNRTPGHSRGRSIIHIFENTQVCRVCTVMTRKKCTHCGKARYCSKECQQKDWKLHKKSCL